MGDAATLDEMVAPIIDPVVPWARRRSDVLGLAVVGSWARGTARGDSDIDLVLLVREPEDFRGQDWPGEIAWCEACVAQWHDADYGVAWSSHLQLSDSREIEFTFCRPSWADTDPVEEGTAQVISGGCRVLLDKSGLFEKLLSVVSR
jgi:nucleotidyltransferase-like protein